MADSRVRVMTWNLWWRFGPRWRDRQPGIVETIRRFSPDVVALQEVWGTEQTTQAHAIAEEFGMHPIFAAPSYPAAPDGPSDDFSGVELGVALVSRWPILTSEAIMLPARHRSWDPVTLYAQIDHPTGPLPVITSCLEHGIAYTDDRIAQANSVADLATDPRFDGACPVIVLGDLNAAANSAVLRSLCDVMTDAWTAGGGAEDAVTLPSTHPSAPLEAGPQLVDQRIDHIFFRAGDEDQQVIVEQVAIAGDAINGTFPSDHRAVIADFRWRNQAESRRQCRSQMSGSA